VDTYDITHRYDANGNAVSADTVISQLEARVEDLKSTVRDLEHRLASLESRSTS
jgi:uncharacterized protein YceH (UPF0502 family)